MIMAANPDLTEAEITARNERVTANLGLAHYVARRFMRRYPSALAAFGSFDDLLQTAQIGLIRAASGYDETIARFSTYAVQGIWIALLEAFRHCDSPIRLPRYIRGPERLALTQALKPMPISPEARRLSAPDGEDGPEAEVMTAEILALLRQAIDHLPERDRRIMQLHYHEGQSIRDIARQLDLTPERTRQILGAAESEVSAKLGGPEEVNIKHWRPRRKERLPGNG